MLRQPRAALGLLLLLQPWRRRHWVRPLLQGCLGAASALRLRLGILWVWIVKLRVDSRHPFSADSFTQGASDMLCWSDMRLLGRIAVLDSLYADEDGLSAIIHITLLLCRSRCCRATYGCAGG